ncbi:MAG: M36 family metallopeptidase [Candidatus Solibacter usitatus]|nr:M36 family metallopeptidase [Candidatus Solibacter usitatus]
MKYVPFGLLLAVSPLLSEESARPVHLWIPGETLMEAGSRALRDIGYDLLRARAKEIGIELSSVDGVYLHKEYKTAHNGVTHLIYRQRFAGIDVDNAEWTVNVDRDGRVLNAGGRLFDAPDKRARVPEAASALAAVRTAVAAIDAERAKGYYPFQKSSSPDGRSIRFHGGPMGADIPAALVWHGIQGRLAPVWRFTVTAADGVTMEDVVVDDEGRRVLAQRSLTLQQSAGKPRGLVYEMSPVSGLHSGAQRPGEFQFVARKMMSFEGDPVASPKGWVGRNETAGNNTITGLNPLGFGCLLGFENCPFRPRTASSPTLDFSFPLEVGLTAPSPTAFPDASIANLFYLTNRAHDLFYAIGFDEAAGNFQAENFTKEGAGGDPVYAYAQYGSAAGNFPAINNASFNINDQDGTAPRMNMYINPGLNGQLPGFFTDGSLDADIVFHEYTHGVSARLARQLYTTFQGGAMGEALSDFFALEFNTAEGAPAGGVFPVAEYLFFQPGRGIRTRPYSTDTAVNPITFANLGRVINGPEVHADGEIFVEALWEMRANLIRQLGEKEGRRRTRLLVVDGMKLAPPAASMLDMRDSILLADSVDFKGESQTQIWEGFAKRGMGVLAQTGSGASTHISASFDLPSPKGSLKFYEDKYVIGESLRIVLQDSNNPRQTAVVTVKSTSGDREQVTLRRRGPVFLGSITTFMGASAPGSIGIGIVPADTITATYADENTGAGSGQVEISAATSYTYTQVISTPPPPFTFPNETATGLRTTSGFLLYTLPFPFPFFETKQTTVRVYVNGIMSFGPLTGACFNAESLRQMTAIAPLFMGIRTNGQAQPNEDVYISTTPDSVTFRWAAETVPQSFFQPPDAVNVATTLFSDGRIQFRYGAGNKSLATGGQSAGGCPTGAPTVGISNGHESFVQLGIHDGGGNLENAPPITWHPPFANLGGSDGVVELPAVGQAVEGIIDVQGIAYESELSLGQPRLDILIDGRAVTSTTPTLPRPDYCRTATVPRCPNVGFRRALDPASLNILPGPHTLQIRATNWRGTTTGFPPEPVAFVLSDKPGRLPVGAIEAPRSGETISGTVTVRGYAYAKDLLVSAVDILIDGVTYGRAQYGVVRTDICGTTSPGANCNTVGFQFNLNTRTGSIFLSNGNHTMQMRVQDESGRYTVVGDAVSVTVNNENTGPSRGVLVSPRPNDVLSGTVRITGHAWDPAGRITSAVLVVGGFGYLMNYGRPRPEECAALPGIPACPNIGFEYDLDTRRLPNGPQILSIRLTNDRGTVTTFPLVNSDGINVFVRNP